MPNIELSDIVDDSTIQLDGSTLKVKDAGITLAKQADLAQATMVGRPSGAGTGVPTALTANQVSTVLDAATDPFVRTSAAGGGGGDSSHTAAYASRPAASNDGALFFPSDGLAVDRDTGAAWVPWGPIFPLTVPVDGDFAWINQETAAITAAKGGIYLFDTAASAATLDMRIRKKAAPATPYTITAAFLSLVPGVDFAAFGLLFRQSSDGKLAAFRVVHNTNWTIQADKWTDATNFSASYTAVTYKYVPSPIFLRIADNGTNRICSVSADGQNWAEIHSIGRTDFMTADEVGFFINPQTTSGLIVGATLIHWKQA
jgi:hypothetical protein